MAADLLQSRGFDSPQGLHIHILSSSRPMYPAVFGEGEQTTCCMTRQRQLSVARIHVKALFCSRQGRFPTHGLSVSCTSSYQVPSSAHRIHHALKSTGKTLPSPLGPLSVAVRVLAGIDNRMWLSKSTGRPLLCSHTPSWFDGFNKYSRLHLHGSSESLESLSSVAASCRDSQS
jgi:hypothetical protein